MEKSHTGTFHIARVNKKKCETDANDRLYVVRLLNAFPPPSLAAFYALPTNDHDFCFVSSFAALSICMTFLRPKILVRAVGKI